MCNYRSLPLEASIILLQNRGHLQLKVDHSYGHQCKFPFTAFINEQNQIVGFDIDICN